MRAVSALAIASTDNHRGVGLFMRRMRLRWIHYDVLVVFPISQSDLYFLGLHLPNSPTAAHTIQAGGSRKTPPALAHVAGMRISNGNS